MRSIFLNKLAFGELNIRALCSFIFVIYVFTISCEMVFTISVPGLGSVSLSRLTALALLVVFILYFMNSNMKVVNYSWNYIWLLGLVLSYFISCLMAGEMDIVKLSTYLSLVLITFVSMQFIHPVNLNLILLFYGLGGVVTAFGTVLGFHFWPELLTVDAGYGRVSAFGFDKNDMTMILNLSMLCLLLSFSRLNKIVFLTFWVLIAYAIILSASKTGFITLMLNSILIVFILSRRNIIFLPVSVFVSILALYLTIESGLLPEYSVNRLMSIAGSISSGDYTGREVLWSKAIEYFFSDIFNILFGGGVGLFRQAVDTGMNMNPHNVFLSTLFDGGIFALILIMWAILIMGITFFKQGLIFVFIFLNICISAMMLNWEISKTLWFFFAVGFVLNKSGAVEDCTYYK